jgi:hypothetical protein
MAIGIKNIIHGALAANYSEESAEKLTKEYGMYLMTGETIIAGFKLIRDALIFTDKRVIITDKQEVTGLKITVISINLFSIIEVKMESSGLGFDDSELTFTYISSPYLKGHQITYASHRLEFPSNYDVQSLYRILQEIAYHNCLTINGLD